MGRERNLTDMSADELSVLGQFLSLEDIGGLAQTTRDIRRRLQNRQPLLFAHKREAFFQDIEKVLDTIAQDPNFFELARELKTLIEQCNHQDIDPAELLSQLSLLINNLIEDGAIDANFISTKQAADDFKSNYHADYQQNYNGDNYPGLRRGHLQYQRLGLLTKLYLQELADDGSNMQKTMRRIRIADQLKAELLQFDADWSDSIDNYLDYCHSVYSNLYGAANCVTDSANAFSEYMIDFMIDTGAPLGLLMVIAIGATAMYLMAASIASIGLVAEGVECAGLRFFNRQQHTANTVLAKQCQTVDDMDAGIPHSAPVLA